MAAFISRHAPVPSRTLVAAEPCPANGNERVGRLNRGQEIEDETGEDIRLFQWKRVRGPGDHGQLTFRQGLVGARPIVAVRPNHRRRLRREGLAQCLRKRRFRFHLNGHEAVKVVIRAELLMSSQPVWIRESTVSSCTP